MKTKLFLPFVFASLLIFSGCQKENDLAPSQRRSSPDSDTPLQSRAEPSCETTFDLMAGQHFLAGQVIIRNDADSVYVGFVTDGWELTQTHLYIGDCDGIPVNGSRNPVPGRFPESSSFTRGVSEVWYSFPLSSVPVCGCIAAHAVVTNTITGQTETAWGGGTRFTNRSWAMYGSYCLCTRMTQ